MTSRTKNQTKPNPGAHTLKLCWRRRMRTWRYQYKHQVHHRVCSAPQTQHLIPLLEKEIYPCPGFLRISFSNSSSCINCMSEWSHTNFSSQIIQLILWVSRYSLLYYSSCFFFVLSAFRLIVMDYTEIPWNRRVVCGTTKQTTFTKNISFHLPLLCLHLILFIWISISIIKLQQHWWWRSV